MLPTEPVVRSSYLQRVCDGDTAVIWHSLFGNPLVISTETLAFLDSFDMPKPIKDVVSEETLDEQDIDGILELLGGYFLVSANLNERDLLEEAMRRREVQLRDGNMIEFLELIMSEACNFRCTYCIHFNNLETSERADNRHKLMRFSLAKEAIDKYLAILRRHGKRAATINFGGGEPLLAWPVVSRLLEYCTGVYGDEFEFQFLLNTNSSLITPEIAAELKKYAVQIATSLDGVQDGNDLVRLTRAGRGTFEQIVRGLNVLTTTGYPVDGFAVTVTADNFGELDERVIDWAAAHRMNEVRIDIDVLGMTGIPIEGIVSKLMRLRAHAKKLGVDVPGFWSRPTENLNQSALDDAMSFCGAVRGNSLCVDPTGKVYACGYSTIVLGNVATLDTLAANNGGYQQYVRSHLPGRIDMCRGCIIEAQCGGGCAITQEFARATSGSGLERMCEFYRRMTEEILREALNA